jgi:cell wall-associated NlpC family hydrolase
MAVQFACAQFGKSYVWGGNGDPGFDCSVEISELAQDAYRRKQRRTRSSRQERPTPPTARAS